MVNLSFYDFVVNIIHPVAAGSVAIVPLAIILALRLILLVIVISLPSIVVSIMSPAFVLPVLWLLLTIVAFLMTGDIVIIAALPVILAVRPPWRVLLRVAAVLVINRWPLDIHDMVMFYRHPMTRYPDITWVRIDIVALNPVIFFIWVSPVHFKLNTWKSKVDRYLSAGHSLL
jgi:hypothetical protein